VTNVVQAGSETYASTSVTLEWSAPNDTGCQQIDTYKIEAYIADVWQQVGVTSTESGVADLTLTKGEATQLRVIAIN
jgi:hypothetical protein